jgi:alpha-galactosidase
MKTSIKFELAALCAAASLMSASSAEAAATQDLAYSWAHPRLVVVQLMDDTDRHNELYFEREYLLSRCEKPFEVSAPALFVEDSLCGEGVAFFRQAPLPHARADKSPDYRVDPVHGKIVVLSNAYPCVKLRYSGGRPGRVRAATDFHKGFRPYAAGRDGLFLSNTWGDGNRDACINEQFLMREVEAGAELGVDVIQIDDGWQKGRSANSAALAKGEKGRWGSWWDVEGFWDVDPVRFPNGLKPVIENARSKGMKFGLWFGPDSSNDAANWEKDAELLLKLHRTLGVDYFKLDSMKTPTPLALSRQAMLMDRLMDESGGRITVDLDVTAGVRPGYFGFPKIGPVFVENRYIRKNETRLWWPHFTLRNLWSLAHVVDPARLRMEVLNPERMPELYPEGDRLAPVRWPRDAIFAISMLSSPLGWFEIQNLSPETVSAWKPLIARWKQERDAVHDGYVYPVGARPDGVSWTGFVTASRDETEGTVLLFRELDDRDEYTLPLSGLIKACGQKAVVIGGRGEVSLDGDVLKVSGCGRLDFVWVKISGGRRIKYVAHRGDYPDVPEGSMAAYRNAVARGSEIVKLDVHPSKDGVIVMSHDPTFSRTMGWDVKIADVTWDEIQRHVYLHKKSPTKERAVSLPQALEVVKVIPEFWIDFKHFDPEFAERVLAEFAKAGIDTRRIMVATYTQWALRYMKERHPEIRRVGHMDFKLCDGKWSASFNRKQGVLYAPAADGDAFSAELADGILSYAKEMGLWGVNMCCNPNAVTKGLVARLKESGLWVSIALIHSANMASVFSGYANDCVVTRDRRTVKPIMDAGIDAAGGGGGR